MNTARQPRHAPTPDHLTAPAGWQDRTAFAPQSMAAMFTNEADGWIASVIVRPDQSDVTWVVTPSPGVTPGQPTREGRAPDTDTAARTAERTREHLRNVRTLF